jgi:acyl CoA:acetate/3-ketoacid CoA transferase
MKGVGIMTIMFRTYDVSHPGVIEDMMLHAFVVERALTMYDVDYTTDHSERALDIKGDEHYFIKIMAYRADNLDEYVMKEIKGVIDHFNARDYCGAEIKYYG